MSLPEKITIREVGPREGFQINKEVIPTDKKLLLLEALAATGVTLIEATSIVRADKVPQHADSEEVLKNLASQKTQLFSALYLNQKGFEILGQYPYIKRDAWIHTSACEAFLQKNSNRTWEKLYQEAPSWITLFSGANLRKISLMVSNAFGSHSLGNIPPEKTFSVVQNHILKFEQSGGEVHEVCLADTIGVGTPEQVRKLIRLINHAYPKIMVSLHLHDTCGQGIANAYAGLLEGVSIFESSVGGIGGCPFTPGATGNISTEELIFLCEGLGIKTGISIEKYIEAAKLAQQILGKKLPSKLLQRKVCAES